MWDTPAAAAHSVKGGTVLYNSKLLLKIKMKKVKKKKKGEKKVKGDTNKLDMQ